MTRRFALSFVLLATLALSACGFHLRGPESTRLPFHTIYIGLADNSPLGSELKRYIRAGGDTKIVDDPKEAEANLEVLSETRDKSILTLNSVGQVSEYTIYYRFRFRVKDLKGQELLAPTEITLKRDMSYSNSLVLSKDQEEQMLYREMQSDLVQQILRRLNALKPVA
jgi:LPS-assembly lipoprotein